MLVKIFSELVMMVIKGSVFKPTHTPLYIKLITFFTYLSSRSGPSSSLFTSLSLSGLINVFACSIYKVQSSPALSASFSSIDSLDSSVISFNELSFDSDSSGDIPFTPPSSPPKFIKKLNIGELEPDTGDNLTISNRDKSKFSKMSPVFDFFLPPDLTTSSLVLLSTLSFNYDFIQLKTRLEDFISCILHLPPEYKCSFFKQVTLFSDSNSKLFTFLKFLSNNYPFRYSTSRLTSENSGSFGVVSHVFSPLLPFPCVIKEVSFSNNRWKTLASFSEEVYIQKFVNSKRKIAPEILEFGIHKNSAWVLMEKGLSVTEFKRCLFEYLSLPKSIDLSHILSNSTFQYEFYLFFQNLQLISFI
ncbi:hypothetical protein GEMRC1_007015 [Eukaryota sp. GEM-RC1]